MGEAKSHDTTHFPFYPHSLHLRHVTTYLRVNIFPFVSFSLAPACSALQGMSCGHVIIRVLMSLMSGVFVFLSMAIGAGCFGHFYRSSLIIIFGVDGQWLLLACAFLFSNSLLSISLGEIPRYIDPRKVAAQNNSMSPPRSNLPREHHWSRGGAPKLPFKQVLECRPTAESTLEIDIHGDQHGSNVCPEYSISTAYT